MRRKRSISNMPRPRAHSISHFECYALTAIYNQRAMIRNPRRAGLDRRGGAKSALSFIFNQKNGKKAVHSIQNAMHFLTIDNESARPNPASQADFRENTIPSEQEIVLGPMS